MADANSSTVPRAPNFPFSDLADLADSYEALASVSADFLGHSSPVLSLLGNLNRQLRALADLADVGGMLP